MFDYSPPVASSPQSSSSEEKENKVWNLDQVFDFSSSLGSEWKTHYDLNNLSDTDDHHDYRVNMKALNYLVFYDGNSKTLATINLKTKEVKSRITAQLNPDQVKIDHRGRVIVTSTDRKNLQILDMEVKSRVLAIQTNNEYSFVDWLDEEHIVFVEGNSLCKLKVENQGSHGKEIIIENLPTDFNKDIVSIGLNQEFYAVQRFYNGELSFYLYKPHLAAGQIIAPISGACLMEDTKKLVLFSPSIGLMFFNGSERSKESVTFSEKAYMTHYFKESQLVAFIGYKGDSGIIDLSSKTIIARHDFKTAIVNSFKTIDHKVVVVTREGKVIQCNFNATFMLNAYRNNYEVSTEIINYWKDILEKNIQEIRLSSIHSIIPLKSPLKQYNRDYYIPHGGIHVFHPIISFYFPIMYQYVIRNELFIEYTPEEQTIIKEFVSYLIYKGSADMKIDKDNYLKWMLILDRCWSEFTELESKIVTLFNTEVSVTSEIAPFYQLLTEYQSRNLNYEGGLLQKCINYCRDIIEGKHVSQIESSTNEHSTIRLSADSIYNRQDGYDIFLVAYGKKIGANRTILASASPMLEVMLDEEGSFKSEISENHELILDGEDKSLSDTDKERKGELFELLVKYCYFSEVACSPEDAFLLYELADQYQITDLKTSLADKILAQLSIDTFMEILKWSDVFLPISNIYLHKGILEFANNHGKNLLTLYSDQLVAFPEFLIRMLKFSFNVE